MFKLTLRNIRGRKLRYALTTFAVVLGVAFLSTSFFLTDRIRETFDDLALDIVGEADLAVRASFGDGDRRNQLPIPAELTRVVTSDIPGVATVEASIIAFGVVPLYVEDGKPQAVASAGAAPGLGFNFNGVDGFNNIWVVKGRAPEHVASPDGEEVVGEFALATNVAEDHNFAIGEIYTISAPSGNRDFTLVGLVHWGSADKNKAVWATVTVFDNWTAQEFLNRQGRYDSLSVLLEPEADRAEVATLIQAEIDAAVAEFKLMVWLLPQEEQQAWYGTDAAKGRNDAGESKLPPQSTQVRLRYEQPYEVVRARCRVRLGWGNPIPGMVAVQCMETGEVGYLKRDLVRPYGHGHV